LVIDAGREYTKLAGAVIAIPIPPC
jgi:hypothetical protein